MTTLDDDMDDLMKQIAGEVKAGKIKGNARIAALKQVKDYYLAKKKLQGDKPSGSALKRYNDQINGTPTEADHGNDATDPDPGSPRPNRPTRG